MKREGFDPELWHGLGLLRIMDLAVTAQFRIDGELRDWDVNLSEIRVLAFCAENPGCTASQISVALPLEVHTISRIVNSLFQKGLLTRRRSRLDRRTVRLRPTANGLSLLQECQVRLGEVQQNFLQPLTGMETDALVRQIEKLLDGQA